MQKFIHSPQKTIVLLFLFIILPLTLTCTTQCKETNMYCTLCFQECSSETLVSCQSLDKVSLGESQCLANCCNGKNLTECIEESREMPKSLSAGGFKAIIIVCSIVLVVLLVVIIREIYKRLKSKLSPQQIQNSQIMQDHHLEIRQENSRLELYEKNKSKNRTFTKPEPNNEHSNFPINCAEILQPFHKCCICLEEGSNTVTQCGHGFHAQCLAAWSDRKSTCPLCTVGNINEVKIFCVNCFNEKDVIDFRNMNRSKLGNLLKEKCEFCG